MILAMKKQPELTSYFGRCLQEDGTEIILKVKAGSVAQASEKLHRDYHIALVMDILTQEEMEAIRRHRKGSYVRVFNLK